MAEALKLTFKKLGNDGKPMKDKDGEVITRDFTEAEARNLAMIKNVKWKQITKVKPAAMNTSRDKK